MYFPSKKDRWLRPLWWGCIIVCFLPLLFREDFIFLVFTIPLAILLIWSWFTTGYIVKETDLIVKSGPLTKGISIHDIKKVTVTKNPFASPALSVERLGIIYGDARDIIFISPFQKEEFIRLLTKINPKIQIS
ncbi:PH domain-containing protein [Bacillus manliponensis]|uniref:PH domain-containing protein n=1 Tax=Bacillus manliponensis TaxID=574376 RepID=UPI003515D652